MGALAEHLGPDRLVEQGEVIPAEGHPVVEPNLPLVDRVKRGDRHPKLGHALLRIELVRFPSDRPALVDRFDRNPDTAVELPSKGRNSVAEEGGRLDRPRRCRDHGLRHSDFDPGGRLLGGCRRRRLRLVRGLDCCSADLGQSGQRERQTDTGPK
jgi:hypothetical protein